MTEEITLQDRSIIEIKGSDRKSFLQGLITNDINKIGDNNLIYAAMLNASGRFLYDFFIFEKNDSIFLDCLGSRQNEIITKLKFYKLRTQVEIIKHDDYKITQNFDSPDSSRGLAFKDPRHKDLGYRIYNIAEFIDEDEEEISYSINKIWHNDNDAQTNDLTKYHYRRICLKIPESEHDLTYEKSIIAEFNFDNLNAIDYTKGCYIGQELTARTHHTGQIRKKIFHATISDLTEVEKNSEISCEEKNSGIILSTAYYENELHALVLIKITEDDAEHEYKFQNNKITIIN